MMTDEFSIAFEEMVTLSQAAEGLMTAGFNPNHVLWLAIILILGRPIGHVLTEVVEEFRERSRTRRQIEQDERDDARRRARLLEDAE